MFFRALIWYFCASLLIVKGNSESFEQLLQQDGLIFPPWLETGERAVVTVSLHISNVREVSSDPKELGFTFYMHHSWHDPRLRYNTTVTEYAKSPVTYLTVPISLRRKIWTPDIHIKNAISVDIVDSPTPNYFMRIYPDGTLTQSISVNCVLVCSLVEDFPRHHQTCNIKLESYSYSINEILLDWQVNEPVDYNADIQMPFHKIISTETTQSTETLSTGSFSDLIATIDLERMYNIFPVIVYIPSFFLVLLAWSSFWIDRQIVPARTSLCALLIMAEVTHSGAVMAMMVNTSMWEPVEVWIGTCLVFLIIATLEFVVVHTLTRLREKQRNRLDLNEAKEAIREVCVYQNVDAASTDKLGDEKIPTPHSAARRVSKLRRNPGKLDSVFRWLFPVLFTAFNVFYWPYFLM